MFGIFDSGLGGLTSVKEIKKLLPNESFVYFGDTGRTPYGTRSKETVIKYAMQDARFLLSKNVDAILVACGTVSSTALSRLNEEFSVPIVGVIEPACNSALSNTKNNKIGVIGTSATIASGAYAMTIKEINPDIEVTSTDCPLFVPLVENGFTDRENKVTHLVAEQYLEPIKKSGCDTLILGCTHYPIIEKIIGDCLPGVKLINAGKEAADVFAKTAADKGLLGRDKAHSCEYYISDEGSRFEKLASLFLEEDISGKIFKTEIDGM